MPRVRDEGPIWILTDSLFEHIFSFLPYEIIAKNRPVCKKFNIIGQRCLNDGFTKVSVQLAEQANRIKKFIPKRVSQRKNHPLGEHYTCLVFVDKRLSALATSYVKYIELNACCFIPGKVLDIMRRFLNITDDFSRPMESHNLIFELGDFSEIAIAYFKETIVPILLNANPEFKKLPPYYREPFRPIVYHKERYALQLVGEEGNISKYRIDRVLNQPKISLYTRYHDPCVLARTNKIKLDKIKSDIEEHLQSVKIHSTVSRLFLTELRMLASEIYDIQDHIDSLEKKLEDREKVVLPGLERVALITKIREKIDERFYTLRRNINMFQPLPLRPKIEKIDETENSDLPSSSKKRRR